MSEMDSDSALRVVLVDDEPFAREALRALLNSADGVEVLAECSNGKEALAVLQTNPPDLLFLDVEMPEMTGLELLAELPPDKRPAVIFTTAYAEYALDAFEVDAIDYLKKPFDEERFSAALSRARERLRPSADARGTSSVDRLTIHREGRLELIDLETVEWI